MTETGVATEGRRLGGRYRTEALLATGGMGEVWAARDLLLDRAVAVKVLGGTLASDGRAAERLRREARAAARLEHPSIARVLDLGEQDGRPYLVMELLEGESLAARIGRAGAMAPPEAARVVAAVADALEAAHRAGVVHRDVKPGNVFLTSGGEVKVLDFGIASAAGEAALTTGEMLGTPAYLAPERVLGHPATPAADIYALGVVLYELLAGRRPFDDRSDIELALAHVHAHPERLALAAPSAPPFLAAACEQAMAKDPTARPPSAATFARLVRAQRPGSGLPATRPLPLPDPVAANVVTPRVAGRRRSRSARRGLLVALLVAGTVLAALPVLGGGSLPWAGDGLEPPFVVRVPGGATPTDGDPGQGSTDPGAPSGAQPSGEADPPAGADPAGDDLPAGGGGEDRDRDDDSSDSGRSGGDSGGGGSGGGDSGGGGSSGGGSSGPG
jgi:tRNA A-37 threonylcarbamoyl transferase component Bud32